MEIKNFTDKMERAQAFIEAKFACFDTAGVSLHIKYTKAKGRDLNGYYRFADRRIVVAVKKRLRYPRRAAYGVGTKAVAQRGLAARPYKLIWHEEGFGSPDDLLVFAAGHEAWHYLCHSGQRKGDFETRANCNGFLWLAEFQNWVGPGHRLEPIPKRPPRPDITPIGQADERGWIQGDLFGGFSSGGPSTPSELGELGELGVLGVPGNG